jgi:UDP-3-O-[3-hydroxymyristoyl] glucosamine N-acyltransferase
VSKAKLKSVNQASTESQYSLAELAKLVEGRYEGDGELPINGVAGIREATTGQISFLANSRYLAHVKETSASALIVNAEIEVNGIPAIRVVDPYLCYLKIVRLFARPLHEDFAPGISERASVADDAVIGAGVHIADFVHIGKGCRIGKGSVLMPGVVLLSRSVIGENSILFPNVTVREECQLGEHVLVHAGSVIGSDGFGYAQDGGKHHKIPQIGHVVIESDVEIGANVTIDRATTGITRIGRGSKIDNLVQIGHNTEIGENCIVVAQVGISGSTRIGKYVTIGGQAGIVGHIDIGDGATIAAQAGVTKSVPSTSCVSGYPARPHDQALRVQAVVNRLPELARRLKELEKEVEDLKSGLRDGESDAS